MPGELTDDVLRYTAFTSDPAGGNPAGVVLDARGLDAAEMVGIAAEVGYSETAFLVGGPDGDRRFGVRYFSPKGEVSFCGHATVASAVALAERIGPGEIVFETASGAVPVSVTESGGQWRAELTSVAPYVEPVSAADVDEALALLGWRRGELDESLPPRIAYAGARHLVLAAATRERLAALDYDFAGLAAFMTARDSPPCTWSGGNRPIPSASATRSRSAAWWRIRQRARPRRRSARIFGRSRRRRRC